MAKVLATLKKKYEKIAAHERGVAMGVAPQVVAQRPIGVWEFLIPMVFILTFLKNRQAKDLFVENFLFTKKKALKAAYDMAAKKKSREQAKAEIEKQTTDLLAATDPSIYSDDIRTQQLIEIDLLMEHYGRLLAADGEDYTAMVTDAYGDKATYRAFIENLISAEKGVAAAAQKTLGQKAHTDTLKKIRATGDRIRIAEVERIFGHASS